MDAHPARQDVPEPLSVEDALKILKWDAPYGVVEDRWEAGEPVTSTPGIVYNVLTVGDTATPQR